MDSKENADSKLSVTEEKYEENVYTYREAIEKFGTGRYQIGIFVAIALSTWVLTTVNETYIWIGAKMDYKCLIPESSNQSENYAISYSVANDQCSYSQTLMYSNGTNKTESDIKCTRWSYDKTFFDSTIRSEWDLNSCTDGTWKVSLATSMSFFGILVGCYLFGYLADRFGRMNVFLISCIGIVTSGIGASFSVNLTMLTILRFCNGVFAAGGRNSGYVYLTELLTPKWRSMNGPVNGLAYWACSLSLTTSAKYLRDWKLIQLVPACLSIIFIPFYWMFHESPQWLLAQGRFKEAVKYFKSSAKINKVPFPDNFQISYTKEKRDPVNYIDFVRTGNTRLVTFICCTAWFLNAMNSYVFVLNVGNISGDIFNNMYIMSATGPLIIFGGFFLRYSRTLCLAGAQYLIAGAVAILAIVLSLGEFNGFQFVIPAICSLGRISNSVTWSILYVFTPELYYTNLRVSALSVGSSVARVGGVVSPFILLSADVAVYMPYIIMTCSAAIGGTLALMLPETANQSLPQCYDDMESFHKIQNPCRECKRRCTSDVL